MPEQFGIFGPMFTALDPLDMDIETRYYPEPVSSAVLDEMDSRHFVRYLREMLWDKLSMQEFCCLFFSLTPEHKRKIDGMAVMEILEAYDEYGIFKKE